jgi:hypothetical protein
VPWIPATTDWSGAHFADPPSFGNLPVRGQHTYEFGRVMGMVIVQNCSDEEVRVSFDSDTAKSEGSTDRHSYQNTIVKAGENRIFPIYCRSVTVYNNGVNAIKTEDSSAGAADMELLVYGMEKE